MIAWLKRLLHIDHAPMLDEVRRDEARGHLLRHTDRAAQIADRMAKASREAAERRRD